MCECMRVCMRMRVRVCVSRAGPTPVRLTICKMNSHGRGIVKYPRSFFVMLHITTSRRQRGPHNTYYASVSYKLDHVAALFMIPKGVKAVWFIPYPRR